LVRPETLSAESQRPPLLSRIALGGYPLGGGYGGVDESAARATVDAALAAGWSFVDTAETYLESEERLGRILKGRRDRVFLATKAFPSEAYSYENLRAALEGSLRRLQTDRVDLLQLHGPEQWVRPWGPTPYEEIGAALERLRADGLALHVGVCNLTVEQMRAVASRTRLFSTQNLYSMIDRGDRADELHLPVEGEILPYAREHGVAFLAWSPLSRGILSETLTADRTFGPDDERHYLPRYQPGVLEHYADLAARLGSWARERGRTLTQLAVAWTLSRPGVTSSLVGAKSPGHVEAVAGAEEWLLSEAELDELDALVHALPEPAKAAKMVVWDHFGDDALERLRARRYARGENDGP
jgi:aryl-alcohol dehydrogenase-like predicted oxidoreductase